MKAALYLGNGRFEIVEKPVPQPLPGENLLEVSRVGICGTDVRIFQGHMQNRAGSGRILGHESVAVVRETCRDGKFHPGDRVAVEPTLSCGTCPACRQNFTHACCHLRIMGIDVDGALQQFWAVPEHRCHRVPDTVSDDLAAMFEPLAVAVHSVRVAALHAHERVAVIGAGTVGLLIALLARQAGAKVFVLEINPHRIEFARRFQFDVLNPETPGAQQHLADGTRAEGMNVVFEASGSNGGARAMTSLAATRGRIILVGIHHCETPVDLHQIFFSELSVQGVRAYSTQDFTEAIRLLAEQKLDLAPFISRLYPLEQLQDAVELAASSAAAMKILIRLSLAAVGLAYL